MKGKVFVEVKFYDKLTETEGYCHYEFWSTSEAWEFAWKVANLGLGEAFVIPASLAETRKAEILKNR